MRRFGREMRHSEEAIGIGLYLQSRSQAWAGAGAGAGVVVALLRYADEYMWMVCSKSRLAILPPRANRLGQWGWLQTAQGNSMY